MASSFASNTKKVNSNRAPEDTVIDTVTDLLSDKTQSLTKTTTPHPQTTTTTKTRSRTFLEVQPYIFAYGAAISVFSPTATAYQLCKLYDLRVPPLTLVRMSIHIFPHQVLLKAVQMNASTPVKEYFNPWMAFAAVGVMQGAVYGQSNIHFSRALKIGGTKKVVNVMSLFRGSGFAGMRDMISQGVPFVFSNKVKSSVVDRIWDTSSSGDDDSWLMKNADSIKQWSSVISTSIFATYLSQGLHNFQIKMQADQSMTYVGAVKSVWKSYGLWGMIRGAEARVGLLLLVNLLNEALLKPAWAPIVYEE